MSNFATKLEVIDIFLVEEKMFFDWFKSVYILTPFIFSNVYYIREWFVITPIEGIYTLVVQMCVKSRVSYLPREAGTIEQRFSF